MASRLHRIRAWIADSTRPTQRCSRGPTRSTSPPTTSRIPAPPASTRARSSFRGVLAEAQSTLGSQVGTAVNSYSILAGSHLSDVQGAINPTGNPLDLAIKGSGYFAVQTANGTRYTRDGQFQVSSTGTLITKDGNAVLDTSGNPIQVPTGDIKVAPDGTLSVASADGSAIVGQLGLTSFSGDDVAQAESASLYNAADGATATPATGAAIQQGAIEGANQDAIQGTVQLLTIQRQAEMMQRALSVFHNDLDKTASEELARV